jgi:hypothetical protein
MDRCLPSRSGPFWAIAVNQARHAPGADREVRPKLLPGSIVDEHQPEAVCRMDGCFGSRLNDGLSRE